MKTLIAGMLTLVAWDASAQTGNSPALRIGMVGDPQHQVAWTDAALEKLQAIGFNTVQLNIAWGSRPFNEPLNLANVVTVPGETELPGTADMRVEIKRRAALAKKHGLRTLFHFGSPYMDRNPYTGEVTHTSYRIDDVTTDSWYDILNPKVRDHEAALLRELRRQLPDIDDILVYTYDQDAWQTPEYQYNSFSYGVPLSRRLPAYLAGLHKIWTEGRSGHGRMWWEPWELSAGQIYIMLSQLPNTDFGLIIHANIAEAQIAMPVDVWFRNTARMSQKLGIPVVAESFFASATEELEPLAIPAPRLVDEEYLAFMNVPGIVGIKEYYGVRTDMPDLSLDLLQARLQNPSHSTLQLLDHITQRFGPAQEQVRVYLGLLADAVQTYPWDASWHAREVGRASIDHGWKGATIHGLMAPTPSWESTRHARFMKTDNRQPHFWMLEDVQLRCELTAELLEQAGTLASGLDKLSAADKAQLEQIERDADVFRRVARSYALHLRETNVAQMLRQDLQAGRPLTAALVKELDGLLDADALNQRGQGRVMEMRRLYRQSPQDFVRRYLVPVEPAAADEPWSPLVPPAEVPPEKGLFTLTTR